LNSVRKEIARIYTVMREIELGITIRQEDEGAA
jgi:ribosomal protein L29